MTEVQAESWARAHVVYVDTDGIAEVTQQLDKLSELRPTQPAAQGTLRNRGLTPLTRSTTAHRQEQEALRRYQAAVTAARELLAYAERA